MSKPGFHEGQLISAGKDKRAYEVLVPGHWTTFVDMGIGDVRHPNFGLAKARMFGGKLQRSNETIVWGVVDNPFSGLYFDQFLISLSPEIKPYNLLKDGAIADWRLPQEVQDSQLHEQAKHDKETKRRLRRLQVLDAIHAHSPFIGPIYRDFQRVAPQWIRAMKHVKEQIDALADEPFIPLWKIRFVDAASLRNQYPFCLDPALSEQEKVRRVLTWASNRDGAIYVDVEAKQGVLPDAHQRELGDPYHVFFSFSPDGKTVTITNGIDPKNKADLFGSVTIQQSEGTESGEPYNWEITDIQFPQAIGPTALYPAFAYRIKHLGGKREVREYLSVEETMALLAEQQVPFLPQADAFLGRLLLTYFAREKTATKKEMGLRRRTRVEHLLDRFKLAKLFGKEERLQQMAEAQMPVYHSFHAKVTLSSPVIKQLEQGLAA